MLLGAVIGDIAGSDYEFNNVRSKDINLIPPYKVGVPNCYFTDDSVMSLAIADALCGFGGDQNIGEDVFKDAIVDKMVEYGKIYPYCGYGGGFRKWIISKDHKPYNSYGNGSAMRVSPVAWYFKKRSDVTKYARFSAEVTHNHPEGVKGAVTTAEAIHLAIKGSKMNEIKKYVCSVYPEIDSIDIDALRETYEFDETCQGSVPQALACFLKSTSFEDAILNSISIGGDSDTIAAIAASIAEPFYGIPADLESRVIATLDMRLLEVSLKFDNIRRKK